MIRLDQGLTDRVFELVKKVPLETTENTVRYLGREYPGEAWADRQPQVMRGTSVTSDNFWKGKYDHLSSESSIESVDIFETAMQNCFATGKILLDAILEGKLQ